jgi:3-oxoacyl-[acyl-carrier-protein] synthase II
MAHRRVVVTGIGIVAPNGIGKDEFWQNLVSGKSYVDRVLHSMLRSSPVKSLRRSGTSRRPTSFRRARSRRIGRFSQFAVAATRVALDDAKLAITSQISEFVGVAYGTSLAGVADLATEMFRGFGAAACLAFQPRV